MSTLLLREAERSTVPPLHRVLLGCTTSLIVPGQPAMYEDETGAPWAVYDDPRVPLSDVALGGAVLAALGSLDYDPTGRTREEIRADLVALTAAARVEPEDVPHEEGADRYAEVMAAQSPPAWVRMASAVPAGWVPVEEGPT